MQKILLQKVVIKNSPAFKEVSFEPTPNFNVFSGASGAGKSVLMESILALFGLKESNAEILEATLELYGIPEELKGLIKDNPTGQGREQTPLVLIRKQTENKE